MCPLNYKVLLRNIKERNAMWIFPSETSSFNLMKYVKDYMKLGVWLSNKIACLACTRPWFILSTS